MNFVLSFCKITSSSRIFSRNFYLPLLKPVTPKDALRTFRITGKWLLGDSKSQHYIPVLLTSDEKKKLNELRQKTKKKNGCVDNKTKGKMQKGNKKMSAIKSLDPVDQSQHEFMDDYTYLIPVLDPNNEQHQLLLEVLKGKESDVLFENCQTENIISNDEKATHNNHTKKRRNSFYVYTVDDKRCNIVFSEELESAIRDGEVIDVMISQRNDRLLLKLKNFKKVPIEMNQFECDESTFADNGCNKEDTIMLLCGEGNTSPEEEKFHHHGKFIMSIAKIFEDKEREAEQWELELRKIIEKRIKRACEATKEYNEVLMNEVNNRLDWRKYEKECKKVVDQINEPIVEHHIGMVVQDLDKTKHVAKVINHADMLHYLPTIAEIPDVIDSMPGAKYHEIEAEISEEDDTDPTTGEHKRSTKRISGIKLTLTSGKECFVSGQMVQTDDGQDVFVPGQTVSNGDFGYEYAPGITVNLNDEVTLINGLIVGGTEEEMRGKPMFCPTDSTITSEGQLTFATTKEERVKYKPRKKGKRETIEQEVEEEVEPEVIDAPPPPPPVEEVKEKPVKRKKKKKKQAESEDEAVIKALLDEMVTKVCEDLEKVIDVVEEELVEEGSEDDGSLAREQLRLELELLRKELLDDGMEEIVANLEEKSSSLLQKLEELRKIKVCLNESNYITYVNRNVAREHADKLLQEHPENVDNGFDQCCDALGDILLVLTRRIAAFRNRRSIRRENVNNNLADFNMLFENYSNDAPNELVYNLKTTLKESIVDANESLKKRPKDQVGALQALCQTFNAKVKNNAGDDAIAKQYELLLSVANNTFRANELMTVLMKELTVDVNENKFELLKHLTASSGANVEDDNDEKVETIEKILDRHGGAIVGDGILKLLKTEKQFLKSLVKILLEKLNHRQCKTEYEIVELLRVSISTVVRKINNDLYNSYLNDQKRCNDLLNEVCAFCSLLDRDDVKLSVEKLMNNSNKNTDCLKSLNNTTKDLIKRYLLLKQLGVSDPNYKRTIEKLINHEFDVNKLINDAKMADLVKESGLLLLDDMNSKLKSSKDVPIKFLKNDNYLAVEDFLIKRGMFLDMPIMLCKKGLQMILPKKTTRAVLAGKITYMLIDENGCGHVKPLHTIEALKLNQANNRNTLDENYMARGFAVSNARKLA